jgi:N-acetylmuramic acid 6-phosphate etherase
VLLKQPRFCRLVAARLKAHWPNAAVTPLDLEGAWGAVRIAKGEWAAQHGADHIKRLAVPLAHAPADARVREPVLAPIPEPPHRFFIPASTALSPTEQRNPRSERLDKLPLPDAIDLMLSEEARVPDVLLRQRDQIERCIRCVVRAFRRGGRLFYVGAGTSGRLGALDASECPPTFRAPPDLVQGIIAGGQEALWRSLEGAEDDAEAGADAIGFRGVNRKDVVMGIAASGRTPFVWGALYEARRRGASTILICFNPHLEIPRHQSPDIVLASDLGPEILTGSTRLKAGTATKLLLNLFTTLAMVQMGKTASNLMVDLNPSNSKLRQRAIRIVSELTGAGEDQAARALQRTGWIIKKALARVRK